MPKWDTINQMLASGETAGSLWNTFESTLEFLQQIKAMIKKQAKNPTELTELESKWKSYEFQHCLPDEKGEICYSECHRGSEKYTWCWTDSAQKDWSRCQCFIRPEVKQWFLLMKKKMMSKIPTKFQFTTDVIQWILIGTIGALLLIILLSIIGRFIYRCKMDQRNANAGQNVANGNE